MTANDAANASKALIASITGWIKLIAALVLAVAVLGILLTLLGYRVPYLPTFKAGLQETGIFLAACAYWLKG